MRITKELSLSINDEQDMTTIYRVTIIDEDEAKLERRFCCRAEAMKFANASKWSSISVTHIQYMTLEEFI